MRRILILEISKKLLNDTHFIFENLNIGNFQEISQQFNEKENQVGIFPAIAEKMCDYIDQVEKLLK